MSIERRRIAVVAPDGARSTLQLHLPIHPRAWLYWVPALGVGIGPNETFADALAQRGIAVAIHEWRGLGSSDRRAARDCDWGYRELLDLDLVAGLVATRHALPGLRGWLGGHSLGGQFALIQAARGGGVDGVLLVASGQPDWRRFRGARRLGVLVFAAMVAPLTLLVGHFPGTRLRFAGREAGRLMREWAHTCRRGDYRTDDFGEALNEALAAYAGPVLAIRMSQDTLAPPGAIERLRELTPRAVWQVHDFGAERFAKRRPDHFGWLREPAAIADTLASHTQAA